MIRGIAGGLLLGLGSLFAAAFYDRYWRWRDCFNDQGRCYDPQEQEVFLEQTGLVWGGLSVVCLVAGIMLVWLRRR